MNHGQVSLRFARLLARLQPPNVRPPSEERRLAAIRARIQGRFDVKRFGNWGSHAKGTAVAGVSDIDIFALMSRAEASKWSRDGSSSSLIRRIRNELSDRYWSTDVRQDEQAVVLSFTDGFSVDVVPAVFDNFTSGGPEYRIPDGDGGWIVTAPDSQRAQLLRSDASSSGRLRPLIRLVKYWAAARTGTSVFKSYYIETALMRWRVPVGMSHQAALSSVFEKLANEGLPILPDSVRSDHSVYPCNTERQRREISEALTSASERTQGARAAENQNEWREAIRQWDLAFNRTFGS